MGFGQMTLFSFYTVSSHTDNKLESLYIGKGRYLAKGVYIRKGLYQEKGLYIGKGFI
jgi:hypothetical protein